MSQQQRRLMADRARSSRQERQTQRETLRGPFRGSGSSDGLTIITSPSVESVMAGSTGGRWRDAMREPASSRLHQQKKHMHLIRPHCVVTPAMSSLRPLRPVCPEFSSSIGTLPARPESVPNTSTLQLRHELRSNTPLHPDLTSPLFSISQRHDAFNSPAPSASRQDYHTPTPSLLAGILL